MKMKILELFFPTQTLMFDFVDGYVYGCWKLPFGVEQLGRT